MKCYIHWCNSETTGNSRFCAVHEDDNEQQILQSEHRGIAMDIAFESMNKGPAIFGGRNPLHVMANTFRSMTTPSDALKNRPTYADAKAQETPSGTNWFERAGERLTDFSNSTDPLTGRMGSAIQGQEDRRDILDNPSLSVEDSRDQTLSDKLLNPVRNVGGAMGAAAKKIIGSGDKPYKDEFGLETTGQFRKPSGLRGLGVGVLRNVLNIPDHRREKWWVNRQNLKRQGEIDAVNRLAPKEEDYGEGF